MPPKKGRPPKRVWGGFNKGQGEFPADKDSLATTPVKQYPGRSYKAPVSTYKPPPKKPAIFFMPGEFKPTFENLKPPPIPIQPTILISHKAATKMYFYVDIADDEVGWLGLVKQVRKGIFYIQDVFLFEQTAGTATDTLLGEAICQSVTKLIQETGDLSIADRMRFWGHSHANMQSVSPSGQDDNQMKVFNRDDVDFMIRGIFNKHGQASFSVYDYKNQTAWHDVRWRIYENAEASMRKEIEAEFATMVKPKVYSYNTRYSAYGGAYDYPTAAGEDWYIDGTNLTPEQIDNYANLGYIITYPSTQDDLAPTNKSAIEKIPINTSDDSVQDVAQVEAQEEATTGKSVDITSDQDNSAVDQDAKGEEPAQ